MKGIDMSCTVLALMLPCAHVMIHVVMIFRSLCAFYRQGIVVTLQWHRAQPM